VEFKSRMKLRRKRIAFLCDSFADEFQSHLLRTAEREVRKHGLDFIAVGGGMLEHEPSSEKNFVFEMISDDNTDAVLIAAQAIGYQANLGQIRRFLTQYARVPRVALGIDLANIPALLTDNKSGMESVVTHLIREHDCKRIAFLGGPLDNPEAQARHTGYR
jgi:DNA-binding LacI/PurR family transcriptional regulator